MTKKVLLGSAIMIGSILYGQVGINTATPHASASLELASTDKALLLNRVANTAAVSDPQNGMIIYDIANKCVKAYQSNPAAWSGCIFGDGNGGIVGTVTGINCAGAYFSPDFATVGQAYTGTLTVPYTGGNGGIYAAQSTTVNGLTFDLPLGVFATGNGSVVYNVTGTPLTAGTTTVSITVGGQSCSGANAISLTVNPATANPGGVLPGTVTLVQNSRYWIASVNDNDYLPYTAPTAPASTAVINAGGGTDLLVDIQGSITTTGITVYIPVTVTGSGGNVGAWSSTTTIPANLTEDGQSRQVELSWAAQTLTASSTSVVATIKAIGGTLNAKKLDINAGIGNDNLGLLLGTFQYPYNQAGALTTYQLRDIPGIPDRMFGQIDNAGLYEHNFLYLPIQAEDGKIWLNNNLGANYANLDHTAFNLAQQATSNTDINAMGSLFQWGRKADGHELVIRDLSVSDSYTFKYGRIRKQIPTWSATVPNAVEVFVGDWTSATVPPAADKLLASSPNNPCPQGFKVPTKPEMQALVTAAGGANQMFVTTKKIRLTIGGHGGGNNPYVSNVSVPAYWLSDGFSGAPQWAANSFYNSIFYGAGTGNMDVTYGKSVRCIQQ